MRTIYRRVAAHCSVAAAVPFRKNRPDHISPRIGTRKPRIPTPTTPQPERVARVPNTLADLTPASTAAATFTTSTTKGSGISRIGLSCMPSRRIPKMKEEYVGPRKRPGVRCPPARPRTVRPSCWLRRAPSSIRTIPAGRRHAIGRGRSEAAMAPTSISGWDNAGRYDYTDRRRRHADALPAGNTSLGWQPRPSQQPAPGGAPAVYDTWTWHYENDGRDQDGRLCTLLSTANRCSTPMACPKTALVDEGTNGRDDPSADTNNDDVIDTADLAINGVDDPRERETWPPYTVPLARCEGDPPHLRTRRPPDPRDQRDELLRAVGGLRPEA